MIQIKICGLCRPEDALLVNRARADWAGFIINYPPSRRSLTPEQALEIRGQLSPGVKAAGVFVDRPLEEVAETAERLRLDAVQLHGSEDREYIRALRGRLWCQVWKAFIVKSLDDVRKAAACPADEILLDGGMGQGKPFDRTLILTVGRRFIIAGGLTPENIDRAARINGVWMADVSSGVETDGVKDGEKIKRAVSAAHSAGIHLGQT
ncbi:MAG: phosphoribosylanthranilate isomerase [Abditibacteriota bacterium]|nr:phosphoribosylanthranilate isomerase [Abditibacteriota bacterium]